MRLRIKTKLTLGMVFLFCIILLTGTIGGYYILRVSGESGEILANNKESIGHASSMLRALDEKGQDPEALATIFEKLLEAQERNVTEPGEQELTAATRQAFENYLAGYSPENQAVAIRSNLYKIIDLNLDAITRKSDEAQLAAKNAISFLTLIGTFCLLIALTFTVNFPGYIANPVKQLTASIKEIANRNYSQRLHFTSNDEFGELADAFNKMAQKLDEYEHMNLAEIVFEKKRIDTIIHNMRDGIIGLNEKKMVLFANPVACELLGMTEKELTGKFAADIAAISDLVRSRLPADSAGKPVKLVSHGKESYFSKEVLEVLTPATPGQDATFIGHVILMKDVTEFRELDAAKTNFIATISHELKTPIASIRMSARLLEDDRTGKMNEEQKKMVEHIKEETQRLLKITGELLNLAQVETGKIQLSFRPVKPSEIIDYATAALRLQAGQKEVALAIDCPADLPPVHADLEKSAWVMVNLLSNAIRYSPVREKVTLQARREKDHVSFSVTDRGTGIDQKYQEKVFEKFFQVPGGRKSGTGLGLAISKEFIESQGGTIRVESDAVKGTTFTFTLPAS